MAATLLKQQQQKVAWKVSVTFKLSFQNTLNTSQQAWHNFNIPPGQADDEQWRKAAISVTKVAYLIETRNY